MIPRGLARQAGAQVVFEPINQIGRARNAGAAVATGEWLLFVDADSILNPGLLAEILQLIEEGRSVGCGSTIHMEGLPWWADWGLKLVDGNVGYVSLGCRRAGGMPQ